MTTFTSKNDDMANAYGDIHQSSPPVQPNDQSNETIGSPVVETQLTNPVGIQESTVKRTLMMALGASPCPSLGLGSSSSGQCASNASNESTTSEAKRQSDPINDSVLSNNVTVRKSMRVSREEKSDDSETSTQLELGRHSVSTQSGEVSTATKRSSRIGSELPTEVTTTQQSNLSNVLMSPMSPDALCFSDGFERAPHYAAPIVNEEIAGLSPIVATRESEVSGIQMSPSELRLLGGAVEAMITHRKEEEEAQASTLSHADASHSTREEQEASQEVAESLSPSNTESHVSVNSKRVGEENSFEESQSTSDDSERTGSSRELCLAKESQCTQEEGSQSIQGISTREDSGDGRIEHGNISREAVDEEVVATQEPETPVASEDNEEFRLPTPTSLSTSLSSKEPDDWQEERVSVTREEADVYGGVEKEECYADKVESEEHSRKDFESTTAAVSSTHDVMINTSDVVNRSKEHESARSPTDHAEADSTAEVSASPSVKPEKKGVSTFDNSDHKATGSLNDDTAQSVLSEAEVSLASSNQEVDSSVVETSSDGNDEGTRKEPNRQAYRDLTSAKKNLDASSMAFIQRLRGAAHRRKLRVARSRDSLAAKEREHLLSIASANERRLIMAPKEPPATTNSIVTDPSLKLEPYKPFKARPVPSTTGHLGSGGQIGVPKVEKKPTTTPFSPLLGARRPQQGKGTTMESDGEPRSVSRFASRVKQSLTPKKAKSRGHSLPFKARPAPPTTGIQGHGGQVGVPKVAKRPATTPVSPCLGNRRSSFPVVESKPKKHEPKPTFVRDSGFKRDATTAKPFERFKSGSEVCDI